MLSRTKKDKFRCFNHPFAVLTRDTEFTEKCNSNNIKILARRRQEHEEKQIQFIPTVEFLHNLQAQAFLHL